MNILLFCYSDFKSQITSMSPNKRADNIKRVTLTLEDELLTMLQKVSQRTGKNRMDIIREAIASYLKNFNLDTKVRE